VIAAASTTIVVEKTAVHWEAVAVTAVPAMLALIGTIFNTLIGRRNKVHLQSIDTAVNGIPPGEPTLRENVESTRNIVQDLAGRRH